MESGSLKPNWASFMAAAMMKLPPVEVPTNTTCSAVEPGREGSKGREGGREGGGEGGRERERM